MSDIDTDSSSHASDDSTMSMTKDSTPVPTSDSLPGGSVPSDVDVTDASTTAPTGGVGDYVSAYLARVRGGDMGSLPALGALVVLVVIFSIIEDGFFSLGNMANLVTQAAPSVLLAMGLVFVLLLGEIDLSAGTTSGVGGATTALLLFNGVAWPIAVLVALVIGMVIGFFIGVIRSKINVPSFVITLALFLGLQGVVILIVNSAHTSGNLDLDSSKVLNAIENEPMPLWLGWTLAVIGVAGFAATKIWGALSRQRRGLPAEPMGVIGLKAGGLAVGAVVFVWLLSKDRALVKTDTVKVVNGQLVKVAHTPLEGVPWVAVVIFALVVFLGFVLTRTRYGRHVYAVGGNAEAARRAGIRVDVIRVSVFVICSTMAMVSGVVLASQIGVNNGQGGGNVLLLAVGAAVIGGTSLFGGKGRITDAVIGGLVVAVITNGMSDLLSGDNSAAYQAIATGIVLLLAATIDALSRRRAGSSGLA